MAAELNIDFVYFYGVLGVMGDSVVLVSMALATIFLVCVSVSCVALLLAGFRYRKQFVTYIVLSSLLWDGLSQLQNGRHQGHYIKNYLKLIFHFRRYFLHAAFSQPRL